MNKETDVTSLLLSGKKVSLNFVSVGRPDCNEKVPDVPLKCYADGTDSLKCARNNV